MAKLTADGVEYELDFDFDIGEARIIKRYAGISLNELEKHNETDPDLIAAFLHIAFKRAEPDTSDKLIESRVNRVKIASIDMIENEEVEVRPPEPSTLESASSDNSSGAISENGAAVSPEIASLATTGHPV